MTSSIGGLAGSAIGGGKGGGGGSGPSAEQMALAQYTKAQGQVAGRSQYAGAGMGTSTNAMLAMAGPEAQAVQSLVGSEISNQNLANAQAADLGNQLEQLGQVAGSSGSGLGSTGGSLSS